MSYTATWTHLSEERSTAAMNPRIPGYTAEYTVTKNGTSEAVLSSITAPREATDTIRYATANVANVYSGAGVDASLYGPTRRGNSVLIQCNKFVKFTDSTDDAKCFYLPVSAHLVLKVPRYEGITTAMVTDLLKSVVGACYDSSQATSPDARLNSLLRSALLPSAMR